jgi:hypothetical protein
VQVLLHRQLHHLAGGRARDDHADLVRERQHLLEHAGDAAEALPGLRELGARAHAGLALAVVAEAGGLQDAGQQIGIDGRERGLGIDQRVRGARDAAAHEMRLLGRAVLADRDRGGAGCDRTVLRELRERVGRDVLELGRDRGTELGQPRQALRVEVAGADVVVRDQPGRAGRVGIEHGRRIAHLLRGMHEHAGELAAAHHAQGGAGRDERLRRGSAAERRGRGGRHFSSALMARAASVWRAR